ncbi:DMT family transporter [Desulfosediminicola sp.]|uniref:DMT family transporter n=1 Tax=Desulfosediminicola sp. TaxID=2886825 RepID=UPI003AF200D7
MQQSTLHLFLGAFLALATAMTVSLATAATKYTAEFVTVEQIVFIQYLFCSIVMLPFLLRRGTQTFRTDHPWLHLIRGAAGWLCFYTYYLALERIPLVDASLLRNTAPVCVPVIFLIWKGIRLPLLRWLPVIMGFIGIAVVLKPQGSLISFWHLIGLLSGITLAGSIVTTRTLALTEPTSRIMFYYFAFSALCSLPLAITNWQPMPLFTIPLMAGIGISIWLTMWFYTRAYSYAKATVISPISYSGVLFTGLLGWLFWGQLPAASALVGAMLIVSGGIWSVYLGREKQPVDSSEPDSATIPTPG